MLDYLVPMLLLLLCTAALRKQENAYELLLEGGKEGLKLLFSLIPTSVSYTHLDVYKRQPSGTGGRS